MNKMSKIILEEIKGLDGGALIADGLDDAIIGYTLNTYAPLRVVYDFDKCVKETVKRDGCTIDEAIEWLEFNTISAFVGESTPIFVKMFREERVSKPKKERRNGKRKKR